MRQSPQGKCGVFARLVIGTLATLMPSLFVPYPIRTPLTAGRPYPVCELLREGLPCPMRCRAVELAFRMTPPLVLLIG